MFYNKFYLNLMFLREGTIEHPGLFTQILSLMKIFNYKLQFSIIRCKNRDTLVDSASESRISGPRDPHPTLARIHVNTARLAYLFHLSLSCIASVSSACLHLHYIKIAAFSSNRTLSDHAARRPTSLIRFAPHRHSPSGSRRPQTSRRSARIRESYRRSRRTILFIGHFTHSRPVRTLCFSFLLTRYFVVYLSHTYRVCNKYARVWPR